MLTHIPKLHKILTNNNNNPQKITLRSSIHSHNTRHKNDDIQKQEFFF